MASVATLAPTSTTSTSSTTQSPPKPLEKTGTGPASAPGALPTLTTRSKSAPPEAPSFGLTAAFLVASLPILGEAHSLFIMVINTGTRTSVRTGRTRVPRSVMDNAMNLTFGVSLTARRVGEVTRPARTLHHTAVSGLGGDCLRKRQSA